MPRKGENIYKRKDGRWEGRFIKSRSPKGKASYGYVYDKSYYAVKEKLRHAIMNQSVNSDSKECIDREFCEVAKDWLNSIHSQIKESSYIKYKNLLRSYIIPGFKNVTFNSLTSAYVQEHCNKLLSEGGSKNQGLSAKTVNDVLVVIRSIIQYARIKGILTSCSGKEVTIKRTSKKLTILQKNDQKRLYQYLIENPSNKNLGILICMLTGLRIGEICALKWDDISLDMKTLYVHQTMQRLQIENDTSKKTMIIISTPKSPCSIRVIPLPDNLCQIILKDYPVRKGYVLSLCDTKYVEPRSMQRYFAKILAINNIKPVNFHALRHTFATRCVEVGFDVKSLSEILGHANVSITMNRYVHPTMELKSKNMQRLSESFSVM